MVLDFLLASRNWTAAAALIPSLRASPRASPYLLPQNLYLGIPYKRYHSQILCVSNRFLIFHSLYLIKIRKRQTKGWSVFPPTISFLSLTSDKYGESPFHSSIWGIPSSIWGMARDGEWDGASVGGLFLTKIPKFNYWAWDGEALGSNIHKIECNGMLGPARIKTTGVAWTRCLDAIKENVGILILCRS